MKEATLERYLKDQAKKKGYLCYKFESPGNRGVPDRLLISRLGTTVYVELKTEEGRLSQLQAITIDKFKQRGCNVHVLRNKIQIDEMLEYYYDQ